MSTAAEKRQAERLADMKARVGRSIENIMELLETDDEARNRVRGVTKSLLDALVPPAKPKKPGRKKYMVRVQELQQWYQPLCVRVTASSPEDAAAKGVRAVRHGHSAAQPDGPAQFLEVDDADWAKLELAGVTDTAFRKALMTAGISQEPSAACVCVASIRKVEVEELP